MLASRVPDQWPVQFADRNACKSDAELNPDGNDSETDKVPDAKAWVGR